MRSIRILARLFAVPILVLAAIFAVATVLLVISVVGIPAALVTGFTTVVLAIVGLVLWKLEGF